MSPVARRFLLTRSSETAYQDRNEGTPHLIPAARGTPVTVFPQYYTWATATILLYDYLLTLPDEVCQGVVLRPLRSHADHGCED